MRSLIRAWMAPLVVAGLLLSTSAEAHRVKAERNRVHLGLREEPVMAVIIPDAHVYYARGLGLDVYRYGAYWYTIENGRWYRARSWRGPFVTIPTSTVPAQVRYVPAAYRINWYGTNDESRVGAM